MAPIRRRPLRHADRLLAEVREDYPDVAPTLDVSADEQEEIAREVLAEAWTAAGGNGQFAIG